MSSTSNVQFVLDMVDFKQRVNVSVSVEAVSDWKRLNTQLQSETASTLTLTFTRTQTGGVPVLAA